LEGQIGGDSFLRYWKRRHDCQPAVVQCFSLNGGEPQAARERYHDGLLTAKENIETLPLKRRMKAADHAATSIAPSGGLVKGFQDCRARRFFRTEECGQ
jgi:hypothetical protein